MKTANSFYKKKISAKVFILLCQPDACDSPVDLYALLTVSVLESESKTNCNKRQ